MALDALASVGRFPRGRYRTFAGSRRFETARAMLSPICRLRVGSSLVSALQLRGGSMRRILVWAVSSLVLAGAAFGTLPVLAQQQDGNQQQKVAELVRLWEGLAQVRDPAERIAGAEQALKLEGELDTWPLPVTREEARARLWRWSGLG